MKPSLLLLGIFLAINICAYPITKMWVGMEDPAQFWRGVFAIKIMSAIGGTVGIYHVIRLAFTSKKREEVKE
jgi:hypothetical protein